MKRRSDIYSEKIVSITFIILIHFYKIVIKQLKKDLASAIDEHVRTETELRHETNRLENEIQSMIEEYDREMFRR